MDRILLVEDDLVFGGLLENYLKMSKYDVTWAKDGSTAYSIMLESNFDLCILDVMMPNMDGFTLGEKIKAHHPNLPFLYLTARGQKEDILKGYKIGASDYLTKPFDVEILLQKLLVLVEKETIVEKNEFQFGVFSFDSKSRILKSGEEENRLSPKESQLLKMLLMKDGEVLERSEALLAIWKEDSYFTKRSMDVYIGKLRKYLKPDTSLSIETIPNLGFILK